MQLCNQPGVGCRELLGVLNRVHVLLLMVLQFRPPIGKYTVELCAGLIDAG